MMDLVSGSFRYFQVSPDGKWLVFRHHIRVEEDRRDDYDLILTTSNDAERKIIPWDEENWGNDILGWIANGEQLGILPSTGFDATWLNEIILFNPFTDQQQRMELPLNGLWWWETVGASVVYDPTLTRAAYLEGDDTLVLWDVENEREIWRFEQPALMIKLVPTWSPDGNFLVLVDTPDKDNVWATEFQILIVNRDGDEVWRSEVLSEYDGWNHLLDSFHWSPDGRYLSYIWLTPEGDEERTFILDTTSFEVLDYCVQASFPVWSPDSKQFILSETIPVQSVDGDETYRNVLVDVEKNIVVQLDNISLSPVAWILNEDP